MSRFNVLLAVLLLGGLGAASSLNAQIVQGRVTEAATGEAVAGASVILLTEDGKAVTGKLTDEWGGFLIETKRVGPHKVRIERIGFEPVDSEVFELTPDEPVMLHLRLGLEVIALEGIDVTGEARQPHLARAGFYERIRSGMGYHMTRAEIDARMPQRPSDLFRTIPGVTVVPMGSMGHGEPVLRNAASIMGGTCLPAVYIDGMPVRKSGERDPALDDIVQPFDIEAIEVYRGAAEIPAQFGGMQSGCGVIVIWTRR